MHERIQVINQPSKILPAGALAGMPDHATDVAFRARTADAWKSMYADCLAARHAIAFEQYIIRNDIVGRRFMALFVRKARAGVKIDLLLDRVGSRQWYGSRAVAAIVRHGGHVRFYHPISWFNIFAPGTWFPRNHTKSMIVDSAVVHIGSVCLADYMAEWRDLHARITGLLVAEIERDFFTLREPGRCARQRQRRAAVSDDPDFDYLVARPHLTPSPIYRDMLARIATARHSIHMATPYFLPPQGLRHALRDAARRGVDVRVILTEQTDVPLAVHVSRSYFTQLLREGIRLFSYRDTVFHAKYTVIDDTWATMGSVNLDYLSLLENREANIVMTHAETIEKLEDIFAEDLRHSTEITASFWRAVPLHAKLVGYAGRSVKRML